MGILNIFFNKKVESSASKAKDRLQIIIASDRPLTGEHDFMPALQAEILAVIAKYINVNKDDIKISKNRTGEMEVLDVNVTLPSLGIVI
jgi:cell division topological specificity factor